MSGEYPSFTVCALTLRAMPISARVVRHALMAACVARIEVSAQCSGSAFGDGVERAQVLAERLMVLTEGIAKQVDYIGHFIKRL